jgi:hypothetical protein
MLLRQTLERNNCERRNQVRNDPCWDRQASTILHYTWVPIHVFIKRTFAILVAGEIFYGFDKQQFYSMVRSRKKEIVAVCDGGFDSDYLCGRVQSRSSPRLLLVDGSLPTLPVPSTTILAPTICNLLQTCPTTSTSNLNWLLWMKQVTNQAANIYHSKTFQSSVGTYRIFLPWVDWVVSRRCVRHNFR